MHMWMFLLLMPNYISDDTLAGSDNSKHCGCLDRMHENLYSKCIELYVIRYALFKMIISR